MRKELDKVYDPSKVEDKHYKNWLSKKYFHAKVDHNKQPYTIVIPPPNITGQLHMGHALDNTIQDIIIRYKRMSGFSALWIPGCDHASISTELKIVEKLKEEGLSKDSIGRDAFLERAWEWKEQYGGAITKQLKRLGSSLDWDRERFTMDDGLSNAVLKVFINLYNKGLIYRGEKLINWCPKCMTTISDAEVNHDEKTSSLYYINYPLKNGGFLQIATTRPETMLGDTCLAVNPHDERYSQYIGKVAVLPLMNREIPIIADHYVEKDFGTGVVKITPAHDPNDFEVSERHEGIEKLNIMNDDGSINQNGGKYNGLDRFEARKRIVEELKELGLLVKVEDINNAVGVHERCNVVVEPLIKLQWFVKMEELAKPAMDVYRSGELRVLPERFGKVYMNWLENIKDWCISRQLWWGHRIPAYYCKSCGHLSVSESCPDVCPDCGSNHFRQDEDTLDTWFSSALWPFSTLGWPEETEEFKYFYPTNTLVTAYDIIFFWVVRMVFSGIEHTGKPPFKDVLIHGLIRDSQGRKFSKSLGNGIDPIDIIEKYGADPLRLMLVSGISSGNDMKFYIEKVESYRNFCNKIWNASRFFLMNFSDEYEKEYKDIIISGKNILSVFSSELTPADKWIISKGNTLIKEVSHNIDKYDFGIAALKIYDFLWDELCDWYIEMIKPRLYNKSVDNDTPKKAALFTLKYVLTETLKLLHPFMPFITEELYLSLQDIEETIMLSKWPVYSDELNFAEDEREVEIIKDAIRAVRNIRAEVNVPPSKKAKVIIVTESKEIINIFERSTAFFETLSFASETVITSNIKDAGENALSAQIKDASIFIPIDEIVDKSKEIERLTKEKDKLNKEVSRIEGKLSNEGFVSKAPEDVINGEKEKLENYNEMLKKVLIQLDKISL